MRLITLMFIGLCLMVTAPVSLAKEKKAPMDEKAMMEEFKKLSVPGEPP